MAPGPAPSCSEEGEARLPRETGSAAFSEPVLPPVLPEGLLGLARQPGRRWTAAEGRVLPGSGEEGPGQGRSPTWDFSDGRCSQTRRSRAATRAEDPDLTHRVAQRPSSFESALGGSEDPPRNAPSMAPDQHAASGRGLALSGPEPTGGRGRGQPAWAWCPCVAAVAVSVVVGVQRDRRCSPVGTEAGPRQGGARVGGSGSVRQLRVAQPSG